MALFCFPEEPTQPLARSHTNTVWRGGGREVMCLWEKKKSCRWCFIVKTRTKISMSFIITGRQWSHSALTLYCIYTADNNSSGSLLNSGADIRQNI